MKGFRIISRSFRDSFKSIFRNFSLSMASIICTTITLVLVAIALILSVNVNHVTKSMEEELTIVVYIKKDVSEDQLKVIESKMEGMEKVEEVTFKSKEEWKLDMMNSSEILETTLESLDNNPLLDSYTVKVKNAEDLGVVAKNIKEMDGIESTNYGEGSVESIISVFDIIKTATIVIVVALIVVTAFLISNTIKLTIFSRHSEIEIMRLVGSSNISIKLPFVIEGFVLGLIGSLVPVIVCIYGYMLLYEKTGGTISFGIIELIKPLPFVLYASLILVVIGCVVGMFGSARAVKKYLKV